MTFEIDWMFCVLLLLTGSSQTLGESSAGPLVLTSTGPLSHVGTSATPNLREKHPGHEAPQQKPNPGRNESSAEATDITESKGAGLAETVTDAVFKAHTQHVNVSVFTTAHAATGSPSAAAHSLSSTPPAQSTTSLLQRVSAAEGRPLLTREPLATFSSQPTHTDHDASPTALASTSQQQSGSVTTATTHTSALGRGPAGPTHQEIPSELNIGDEDLKGPGHRLSSPLDPLLAGLLSIFIVTTAIVFVALFLKFRQRANHPEFHRLQDLPMDDLMEDTPLSRYTY